MPALPTSLIISKFQGLNSSNTFAELDDTVRRQRLEAGSGLIQPRKSGGARRLERGGGHLTHSGMGSRSALHIGV